VPESTPLDGRERGKHVQTPIHSLDRVASEDLCLIISRIDDVAFSVRANELRDRHHPPIVISLNPGFALAAN
jgi:hypothetical protein